VSNYKDSFGQPKPPEQAMAARLTTLHGRDCAKALMLVDAALAASAPQKAGWQPIETAPRDWSQVLVVMRNGAFSTARYDKHSEPQATHWMPLPPAPAQETER
jgi:hypothetical protein